MQTSRSDISIYNLFYIFVCIIWIPVQQYYLHIDEAGRSILLLSVIAILLNLSAVSKFKEVFRSFPFLCWSLLLVYSVVNSMIKGFDSNWGAFEFFRASYLIPFIFLVITIIEIGNNKDRCLKIILLAQLFYLIIGASHVAVSESGRTAAEELGNALPLMASGCAFVASMLFFKRQLRGEWVSYFAIIAFVFFIIIVSGTRKAFGAVLFVVAGMFLSRLESLNLKSFLLTAIVFILALLGTRYVLDDTVLGSRFALSAEQYDVELSSNATINSILAALLGDRDIQYYLALELFPQSPVTGIGLGNFMEVANFDLRLHSEYMVQLCENGLVGFSLLLLFYFSILRGLLKKRKEGYNIIMPLFGFLMILFLNLTVWTYNMQIAMIIYAVMIVETSYREESISYIY